MLINFEIQSGWVTTDKLRQNPVLQSLYESEEELLCSETSMTEHLEELLGAPLEVETRVGKTVRLNTQESDYLEVNTDAEAHEREVWLTIQGKKLIYAHTLIPAASIEDELINRLKERKDEPLGRVLNSLKIPFLKKKLTIALLTSAELAEELNLSPETLFVARRYILYSGSDTDSNNPAPAIRAAVTEIFNPDIISCKKCTK